MIERQAKAAVIQALSRQAAVVLIGPRQVGKTTLALDISDERPALYLDLESAADRAQLTEPRLFLEPREKARIIMDEIHRVPDLFSELRGLIDRGRRKGIRHGRFLMLGSASMDLLRQSGESLAGRIEHVECGMVLRDLALSSRYTEKSLTSRLKTDSTPVYIATCTSVASVRSMARSL